MTTRDWMDLVLLIIILAGVWLTFGPTDVDEYDERIDGANEEDEDV